MTRFAARMSSAICVVSAVRAGAQAAPIGVAYQLNHPDVYDASPSPDGTRLVYVSVTDGKEQLFLMGVDGSHIQQLTHDKVNHEDPAWSPDGLRIAYVSDADSNEVIFTMNIDGSGVVGMTPTAVRAIHPSWSRDGRRILYCTDDDLHPPAKNSSEIYSVDVETHQVTRIITGGVNTYPSLSPDGARIAFRRMVGVSNSEVFVANADGTGARNVTNSDAFDGWPEWSPDGKQLAFASNRNGSYQLFLMDPDGSRVRLVANTTGRATAPHWSPDGRVIYFTNCVAVAFGRDCNILVGIPAPPWKASSR